MTYTKLVNFTATNTYGCALWNDEDDVYTVQEFIQACEHGMFIDDDGFGHPVLNGKADTGLYIYPSALEDIPQDATHIVWYNR